MKGYKIPIFQRGNLLTQEMLDALKCYMTEMSAAMYADYSDGILSGMDIRVSEGNLTIGKGLIKYQDTLIVVAEETVLPVNQNNTVQVVKIVIADKEIGAEFETIDIKIVVDYDTAKKANEIEICRMRAQEGAKLRCEYTTYEDMATEFDTVNLIYADWSAYKSKGIHPEILEQFAKEARKCARKEMIDSCFLQQIYGMSQPTCRRQLLTLYLEERLGNCQQEYTNEEIYKNLGRVLRMMKTGTPIRRMMRETRELRTMVVN